MYIASMALVEFPISAGHKTFGCAFWRIGLGLAKVAVLSYIRDMLGRWPLSGNVFLVLL
jgi:hypothetical protein